MPITLYCFRAPRLNFINVLCTAFTHADPRSVKKDSEVFNLFYAFGIYERESFALNVGEIDTRGRFHQHIRAALLGAQDEKLFLGTQIGKISAHKFGLSFVGEIEWQIFHKTLCARARLFAWQTKLGEIDPRTVNVGLHLFYYP